MGKPSKGTKADKRLSANKPKAAVMAKHPMPQPSKTMQAYMGKKAK